MADMPAVEDIHLIGINLMGEERPFRRKSLLASPHAVEDVIGIVTLTNLHITLEDLRIVMSKQLKNRLPSHFIFLTKEGWPIMGNQESSIPASNILTSDNQVQIRRFTDPPCIAIRAKDKDVLGFVFVDLNSCVFAIRRIVEEHLTEINHPLASSFGFVDKNGWPVTTKQENRLIGWDIEYSSVITITFPDESIPASLCGEVLDSAPSKRKRSNCSDESQKTFLYQHDDVTPYTPEPIEKGDPNAKKILLSYARSEARDHAQSLKQELTDLGFSVFLDIDDITGGADWQDALNEAVQKCSVFVPLVTQKYGETKWTNREVKLADKLRKLIIPVNFLKWWPPECLAIQFCSLHFIHWKTPDEIEQEIKLQGDEQRAFDTRYWHQHYVRRVAQEILKCFVASTNKEGEVMDTESLTETLEDQSQTLSDGFSLSDVQVDGQRQLSIVISVHPEQKAYGAELKRMLESLGYEAWCTTELIDEYDSAEETSSLSGSSVTTPVTPTDKLSLAFPAATKDASVSPTNHQGPPIPLSNVKKLQPTRSLSYYSQDTEVSSSQLSEWKASGMCTMNMKQIEKLRSFQRQVDKAHIVIFVISRAFCDSSMCYKQARYCDFRKQVLAIKYEKDLTLPTWMEMMFADDFIQCAQEKPTRKELKQYIAVLADALGTNVSHVNTEEKMLVDIVSDLKKQLRETLKDHIAIYIAGSTSFYNPKSQRICQALGHCLASLPFVTLVTGGFYGVGEFVARNFCEERELLGEKPAKVYHILPHRDSKDLTTKGRQAKDGTFEKLPYGITLFAGNSVRERDMVTAQLFEYCIVIEGGPGTVNEAEKFMWNDHIVIPIKCTGGAASGKFGMPSKLLQVPTGVHEEDWSVLEKRDVTADDVANAVARIIWNLCEDRRARQRNKRTKDKTVLTKSWSIR